jgi:hypothetical protein
MSGGFRHGNTFAASIARAKGDIWLLNSFNKKQSLFDSPFAQMIEKRLRRFFITNVDHSSDLMDSSNPG